MGGESGKPGKNVETWMERTEGGMRNHRKKGEKGNRGDLMFEQEQKKGGRALWE